MFEENMLTFNPDWDQSGNELDSSTVVPRHRIHTFRQAIKHVNRILRFGFDASQIAERRRQMFPLLIPISEHQVAIAFLEVALQACREGIKGWVIFFSVAKNSIF